MKYFQAFPKTSYLNKTVTNITLRVVIDKLAKVDKSLFHPYTIKDGERPDIVSSNYYGDPYYIWLIFLTNNIIDPYYDWPLDDVSFKQFIIKKYGSVSAAMQQIVSYQKTYGSNTLTLSPDSYSILTIGEQSQWLPYTAFQMETDLNDSKRYIKLVDKSFTQRFDNELKSLLRNV